MSVHVWVYLHRDNTQKQVDWNKTVRVESDYKPTERHSLQPGVELKHH